MAVPFLGLTFLLYYLFQQRKATSCFNSPLTQSLLSFNSKSDVHCQFSCSAVSLNPRLGLGFCISPERIRWPKLRERIRLPFEAADVGKKDISAGVLVAFNSTQAQRTGTNRYFVDSQLFWASKTSINPSHLLRTSSCSVFLLGSELFSSIRKSPCTLPSGACVLTLKFVPQEFQNIQFIFQCLSPRSFLLLLNLFLNREPF